VNGHKDPLGIPTQVLFPRENRGKEAARE
jgi:hypothetical protein